MKKSIRITTSILTTVLFGAFVANAMTKETVQLNEYVTQTELSSNASVGQSSSNDTRSTISIYDGDDIYSDVNQQIIQNELETHVAGGIDDPYNIMMSFASDTDAKNLFQVADTMSYTGSQALWDLDFDVDSINITPESVAEYFGIEGGIKFTGGELTIDEYINRIKDGLSNNEAIVKEFAPEIINNNPEQSVNYQMQYDLGFGSQAGTNSYIYSDSNNSEWTTNDSSTAAENFLGVWIGRGESTIDSDYTLSNPLTPETVKLNDGADFQPFQVYRPKSTGTSGPNWTYMGDWGLTSGFAKMKQYDPLTGEEIGDMYSEIQIDIDVEAIRSGSITDFNSSYEITDLPIGYDYELEEVYLAYPDMTGYPTEDDDGLMEINGDNRYSYATLKGRTATDDGEELSYSSTGEPITFSTVPETLVDGENEYTVDELIVAITDEVEDQLKTVILSEAKLAVEIWAIHSYADFAVEQLNDVLSNVFIAMHLPQNYNFEVVEYGSDYVTFRTDIYEGDYIDPENNEDPIDGLSYQEDSISLFADIKERDQSAPTNYELVFDDITWENNEYVDPANLADGNYDEFATGDYDTSLDDGIRTHIFSVSSYLDGGEEVALKGESEFNNLRFQFFETNPYSFEELTGDYIDILKPSNLNDTFGQLASNWLFTQYDLIEGDNTITSEDGPLFETSLYSRPLIISTFSWHDITSDSAQFSISYNANASDELAETRSDDDKYFNFEPEDVILLWNKDGSERGTGEDDNQSEFQISEAYEIGEEGDVKNAGHLKLIDDDWIVPDDESSSNGIKVLTYEISGLKSYTEYNDFGIYLKTEESDWVINEWSTLEGDDTYIQLTDQGLYLIPSRFPLHTKRPKDYYRNILIIVFVVLIVLIVLISLWYFWVWWKEHMSLSFYYDGEESFNRGELIFNLLHANRYPKIWEAHEEDLILIASGKVLDAKFRKTSSVHKGYRITVSDDTSQKLNALSIISASKYNKYYVGVKGWDDMYHTQVVSDHKAKKIMNLTKIDEFELYEQSKDSLHKEVSARTKVTLSKREKEIKVGHIVSSVSDSKSTDKTIRYQILLPHDHELEQQLLDDDGSVRFYHIYKGRAYRIEHKLIGEYGTMFEYDLINLNPSTIYVGLSVSLDGGKTIYPSASLFGTTKSIDGTNVSKTDAELGKPKNLKVESLPIWCKKVLNENLNKKQADTMIAIMIKKHYEDEHDEGFIPASLTHQYYDDYIGKWFDKAEKEEIAKLKAEIAEKTVEISAETESSSKGKTTTKK